MAVYPYLTHNITFDQPAEKVRVRYAPSMTAYWRQYVSADVDSWVLEGKQPTTCADCHASTHPGNHASSLDSKCRECHQADLANEHTGLTPPAGYASTCMVCHASTRQAVLDAISSGKTSCDACHGSTAQMHRAQHDTTLDARCARCHDVNLAVAHEDASAGCAVCHESPSTGAAIAFSRRACGDCHALAHGQSFSASSSPEVDYPPAFGYSAPIAAAVFAGESWMPAEAVSDNGTVVLAGRANITVQQTWDAFAAQMTDRGWTVPAGPETGANSFVATLSKSNLRCRVVLYQGATHASLAPSGGGTRAEIVTWATE